MLKNAHTLAIGGVDTAENGPPKVRRMTKTIRCNIHSVGFERFQTMTWENLNDWQLPPDIAEDPAMPKLERYQTATWENEVSMPPPPNVNTSGPGLKLDDLAPKPPVPQQVYFPQMPAMSPDFARQQPVQPVYPMPMQAMPPQYQPAVPVVMPNMGPCRWDQMPQA